MMRIVVKKYYPPSFCLTLITTSYASMSVYLRKINPNLFQSCQYHYTVVIIFHLVSHPIVETISLIILFVVSILMYYTALMLIMCYSVMRIGGNRLEIPVTADILPYSYSQLRN